MRGLLLAVSRWEWLLLLILLPLLVYPPGLEALVLLLVPLFWVIRKIATGRFFPSTLYNIVVLVLGLAVLISLFAVIDFSQSMVKIAGLALGVALYFAAVEYCRQSEQGVWLVLAVALTAGTAISVVAVFFADWSPAVEFLNRAKDLLPSSFSRLPGTSNGLVNVNELAGVLAWIIPLLVAVVMGYGGKLWRSGRAFTRLIVLVLVFSLLFNILVLLATTSRGGMLATGFAIVFMLAITTKWGRWLLLIGLVLGALLLIVFGVDVLLTDPSGAAESLKLNGRLEIWERGLSALSQFPVTGLGLNGFRQVVHSFYPLTSVLPIYDIAHAHNHLLQAGLDLGLLGLIAYLAIWFLSAALLWMALRDRLPEYEHLRALQVGLAGSLAAGWFFGLVDTIALGARPGFIWWLLLAMVVVSTVGKKAAAEVVGQRVTAV